MRPASILNERVVDIDDIPIADRLAVLACVIADSAIVKRVVLVAGLNNNCPI